MNSTIVTEYVIQLQLRMFKYRVSIAIISIFHTINHKIEPQMQTDDDIRINKEIQNFN